VTQGSKGVHDVVYGFGGEVIVGEHLVALASDEFGVADGGAADMGHWSL
jgi:hypothetical protein